MMASLDPADYQNTTGPAAVMAKDFGHRATVPPHRHRRHQLIWAESGLMHVQAAGRMWVVPPQRALWVPAEVEHGLAMVGTVGMRTIYVEPDGIGPTGCKLVAMSPLLRALILEAAGWAQPEPAGPRPGHVIALILDELGRLDEQSPGLPWPRDPRLVRLCRDLLADPADARGLEAWGQAVGASARTLARRFAAETGMRFTDWRAQARLAQVGPLLAAGMPVAAIARRLGYQSPSAFTAMRRRLGGAPR